MADFTPEEQFSLLSQQLLLLNQIPAQDDPMTSLEAAMGGRQSPKEIVSTPKPLHSLRSEGRGTLADASASKGGLLSETAPVNSQALPSLVSQDAANASKTQRLQFMQMALIEHQHQLLRQQQHLQQQQRLLLQKSQERNVAPHSLAQLFVDLREARQHRNLQTQQRCDQDVSSRKSEGRALSTGSRHISSQASGVGAEVHAPKHHGVFESSFGTGVQIEGKPSGHAREADPPLKPRHVEEQSLQQKGERPSRVGGHGLSDRRKMLRSAGLLDTRTVLSCTLSALRFGSKNFTAHSSEKNDGSSLGGTNDNSVRIKSKDMPKSEYKTMCYEGVHSALGASPWESASLPYGPAGGRVVQVHEEPLPLSVLCANVSPSSLWKHCLRVTLHARRCAIRTRRYWKAVVPLFPRRSTYSVAAVLSDDDLQKYTSIGPRSAPLRDSGVSLESWVPPKEPFCDPGVYCVTEEGGAVLAAWAVAVDNRGRLRRCAASVDTVSKGQAEEETSTKRKRSKFPENLPGSSAADSAWGMFLGGSAHVGSEALLTLEKWYVQVANEPLTEQHIRSFTLAEYASVFSDYAESLVNALRRLVEMRHGSSCTNKVAESCGCDCDICVGQPCRVRLAWRQHLMAFEVAVDKTAAEVSRSDSSGEEESVVQGTHGSARSRPVDASRHNKGGWEWCRKCQFGCRMQFRLIFHELYQPMSLTKSGLRSALSQLLMRLRRYVTLSPLAVKFLMQRIRDIQLLPVRDDGTRAASVVEASEWEGDEENLHCYDWATRDWAQACWQRRQRSNKADIADSVVTSSDLNRSVARLSMLSASLMDPLASAVTGGKEPAPPADDRELCTGAHWLTDVEKPMVKAGITAEELQSLAGDASRQHCATSLAGPEARLSRTPAASDLMSLHDYQDEGARSPHFSYPVSIASSQVPSACSTPPRQSSRPRLGRLFALPRSVQMQQQGGDGAPGCMPSGPSQECELHIHCDGTGKMSRGRFTERDEWCRPGNEADRLGGDGLDSSPRRLRRMQRGRLTAEGHQTTSGRRVEIPRRLVPLVPWWWEDYIKTGAAQNAQNTRSKKEKGEEGASDSSSVNSTISLEAVPHLFRIPYERLSPPSQPEAKLRPWQDSESTTGAMLARFSEAVDSGSRVEARTGSQQGGGSAGGHSLDLSVDLIHAAAELVDSIQSWPVEFSANSTSALHKPSRSRGFVPPEGGDGPVAESATPGSEATAAFTPGGRKAKQMKGNEASTSQMLEPSSSGGMLTFVSSVLAAPTDSDVGSLRGFELLQGGPKAASSDSVVELDKRGVAEPASEFAEGSGRAPPLDINASTPLLRSLAASSAPAVDSTHDQLLVDDFYMRPLLKGPLPHRDACDPFDRDYTDVQIRLKPLRAFGLWQERHGRHRRRSWRHSPQSAGSSPRGSSPAPLRSQGTTGLSLKKPLQGNARGRGLGAMGERTGTVRIGGRRVVVRTVDDGSGWASREPSAGVLSDFSVSRCSMSVDSSLSSRGVSVCSRATSNAGSVSDASVQGGGTPQSPSAHEGAPRHRRGRSRPPPGGRGSGGGNSSAPTGVYLDVARRLWRCQWRENGRFKTKSFPLNQYKTLKEARRACVVFRCLMGGWEVQPAWLGDDEGADIDTSGQPESFKDSTTGEAGSGGANPAAVAP